MVNCEIACLLARQIGMQLLYSLHKLYMSTFNTKLTNLAVAWKWIMNYLKLKVRCMRRLKKYMRHARFIDKHTKKKKKLLHYEILALLYSISYKLSARPDLIYQRRQGTKVQKHYIHFWMHCFPHTYLATHFILIFFVSLFEFPFVLSTVSRDSVITATRILNWAYTSG